MSKPAKAIIPVERIAGSIYIFRGERVMLDVALAKLYGVPTKSLNLAVRRNAGRFPADFMFQLTADEWDGLRLQSETSNKGRGGRRYLPYAFTEQGVAMLSSVLRSKRAVAVNIEIMRAFVRLRQVLATHAGLARRLDDLERRSVEHDGKIEAIFDAIRALMAQSDDEPNRPRIGYETERKGR